MTALGSLDSLYEHLNFSDDCPRREGLIARRERGIGGPLAVFQTGYYTSYNRFVTQTLASLLVFPDTIPYPLQPYEIKK